MQVRAELTRRLVIDAAVELFDSVGYGNASLADVIAATGVSKGAFYYHFSNKGAVAEAIITEADTRLTATATATLADPSASSLAGIIRTTFVIAELEQHDPLLRVGVQLRGGLGQISSALDGFETHREWFTNAVHTAIRERDLNADLDPDRVGYTIWAAVIGTHAHCGATGQNTQQRLADAFNVILPGICTPEAAPRYLELVDGLVGQRAH